MRPVERGAAVTVILVCGVLAGPAGAQTFDSAPSRFEVAAGVGLAGGSGLGRTDAELTTNAGAPPLVLFTTTAELASSAGLDGRVGVRLTQSLVVSAVASVSWLDLGVSISGDSEAGGVQRLSGEQILQARFEARVDWMLRRLRFAGGRAVPYATASIGVLQQWHQGYTIKESGRTVLAGGGVRYVFRDRPASRWSQAGLTAEAQVCRIRGGYHLGAESRTMPAFGLGFLTGWGRRR
ncbi:MAG: hypothetical protein AB1806_13880 [Acidobacteriota bacterium]